MSKDAARYVHFNLDDVPETGSFLTDVSSMAVGFTRERERGGEGGDHTISHESGRQQACSGALSRHALFRQRQADVAVDQAVAHAVGERLEDGRLDSGHRRRGDGRARLALFCYGLDIGHHSSGNVVLGGPGRLRARPEQGCKVSLAKFLVSSSAARCLSTFLVEAYYERP